ncbi:MAG: fibronectin type III domain-containing protein [bacterium]
MRYCTVLLVIACLAGCGRNRAPAVPDLLGPTTGRPGDTLVFTVAAVDPDGGEVGYKFSWGDTSALEWSPYYASGQPVARMRAYQDTGRFPVRVKARDTEGAESDWSESLLVRIALLPPARPARPTGPSICTTGVRHEFVTLCIHPQGESIRFQFDWAGVVEDWGRYVASGEEYAAGHVFDTVGTYRIAARAQDRAGLVSDWSDYIEVPVVTVPGAPPRDVRLAAASDSTLLLTWAPPDSGTPNAYGILFRPAGGEYELAAETTGFSLEHFPNGLTGDYQVGARFGGAWFRADTVASTLPVSTDNLTLYELNGDGDAGYGWDRASGVGFGWSMRDTLAPGLVDFYVTDFDTGSAGPAYRFATADTAPFDPGDSLPAGPWHRTWFAGRLANDRDPLPPEADSAWRTVVVLGSTPEYIGCRTGDGHHAMLKVTNVRPNRADVRFQGWFQLVPGLRLVRH